MMTFDSFLTEFRKNQQSNRKMEIFGIKLETKGKKIKVLQIWHWELHANDIFDLILVKRLDFCRAWAQLDIMRRGIITTGSYLTC